MKLQWIPCLTAAGLLLAGCSNDSRVLTAPDTSTDQEVFERGWVSHGRAVVANRASGTISVIDARNATLAGTYALPLDAFFTLDMMTTLDVPGAHGAGMSRNGRFLYTTNLPGGGSDALFTIDTRHDTLVGVPTDSPYPVPHNIALDPSGRKLFLTHSGATADKVTVYRMSHVDPVPVLVGEVTVGLDPVGLAYVN